MIKYRKFKKIDFDQLPNVYSQGFSALYGDKTQQSTDQFLKLYRAALLKGIEGEMYIAEKNGTIVGFAAIHQESKKEYKFGPMVILPSFQRQGIGSHLLQMCIDFAWSKHAHQFYLRVHENNQEAIALYKKFGFATIDIFPSNIEGIQFFKMVYKF